MSTHSLTLSLTKLCKKGFSLRFYSSCQSILMSTSSAKKMRATVLRCTLFCFRSFHFALLHYLASCVKTYDDRKGNTSSRRCRQSSSVFHYRMTVIRKSIFEVMLYMSIFPSSTNCCCGVVIVQPVSIDYDNLSRCYRWHRCYCCWCQHRDVKWFFFWIKL